MKKAAVIIPLWVYTNPEVLTMTDRCVQSLHSDSLDLSVIIACTRLHLVSPDDLRKRLQSLCQYPVEVLHEPGVERSVAGAWNWGAEKALAAGCELVGVCGNDTVLEPFCLDRLASYGDKNPDVSLWSAIDTRDKDPVKLHNEAHVSSDGADFACFMFRPETIIKFGWFDHHFKPAYWEDNDYYVRVILGGGKCRVVHGARFYHHGSMTSRLEGDAAHHVRHWFGINKARFAAKWGTPLPPNCTEEVFAKCFRRPWNDPTLSLSFCDR